MSGAREPRPWPKPIRWLVSLLVVMAVVALGILTLRPATTDGDAEASPKSTVQGKETPAKDGKPTGAADRWQGLRAAGIPTPGTWSRQTGMTIFTRDSGIDTVKPESYYGKQIAGDPGPIDTALASLDTILDPGISQDEWHNAYTAVLKEDASGQIQAMGGAPRYWWAGRKYTPDMMCSPSSAYTLMLAYDTGSCTADNTWQGEKHAAIQSIQYYQPGSTSFPVPDDDESSATDPQTLAARSYSTVAVPMDDGIWHITVYCPANPDMLLDWNADELGITAWQADRLGAGVQGLADPWRMTGIGTRQRPCRTVEIAVGGQLPYWFTGGAI